MAAFHVRSPENWPQRQSTVIHLFSLHNRPKHSETAEPISRISFAQRCKTQIPCGGATPRRLTRLTVSALQQQRRRSQQLLRVTTHATTQAVTPTPLCSCCSQCALAALLLGVTPRRAPRAEQPTVGNLRSVQRHVRSAASARPPTPPRRPRCSHQRSARVRSSCTWLVRPTRPR